MFVFKKSTGLGFESVFFNVLFSIRCSPKRQRLSRSSPLRHESKRKSLRVSPQSFSVSAQPCTDRHAIALSTVHLRETKAAAIRQSPVRNWKFSFSCAMLSAQRTFSLESAATRRWARLSFFSRASDSAIAAFLEEQRNNSSLYQSVVHMSNCRIDGASVLLDYFVFRGCSHARDKDTLIF